MEKRWATWSLALATATTRRSQAQIQCLELMANKISVSCQSTSGEMLESGLKTLN